ncbi:MAG: aminotransferase class V-fold PLP-dependent enzyme [Dehalococcoidia bacterium]|nr:aminotransferase class V-fold PLP-dependent enzyme [Dehalococcoidia bacterium]
MSVNLRIPGPTPCPPEVLAAMSGQMINHRGPEFAALQERLTEKLKTYFLTSNDLYIISTSGTGVMETMVVNALSPGDRVLAVSIGAFGDRFGNIAETYGADVKRLNFEWGTAADPEAIRAELKKDASIKAVLVTHNETSTGVTNPLGEIAKVVKEQDRLIIVDAVSSLGSIKCPVDEWQLDFVGTGSQKGWMVPPGIAMVAVSERGWAAYKESKMRKFYFDLGKARDFAEKGQTPWTPTISCYYALDAAFHLLDQEGLQGLLDRHQRLADMTRAGIKNLGLKLFPQDERYASNTVTAISNPEGVDGSKLVKMCREEYGVVFSGGQAKLSGQIFRIGHLGMVNEDDISSALSAIEKALGALGYSSSGVAVTA